LGGVTLSGSLPTSIVDAALDPGEPVTGAGQCRHAGCRYRFPPAEFEIAEDSVTAP
jgi:hypothetical protein